MKNQTEQTITTKTNAAKVAEISPRTVTRMLEDGRIKGYQVKGWKTEQVCVEEVLQALKKEMTDKEKIERIKEIIN